MVQMPVEAVASKKTITKACKQKRKARKQSILNNVGGKKLKNNQNGAGPCTCLSFAPIIRFHMNEADREELRRVSVQAADEQWSACWDPDTLSGSSEVGEARPYAYLGKAKLRNVPLARILYFLQKSNLSDELKKECANVWKSKNLKQRTTTLKMFADEALQVYVNGGRATCYFGWHHWEMQVLKAKGYTDEDIQSIINYQKDLYDDQIAARTKLARAIKYGDVVKFKLQSGSPSAAASAFAIEKIHTIRLPEEPSPTVPRCNICGFESSAPKLCDAYKNIRNHRATQHPQADPQPDLAPGTGGKRQELSVLAGAKEVRTHPNYFDGLLTLKFAELAETHHSYASDYYEDVTHKRQLNNNINKALRGQQACAHGIDFCIWDAKKQCWVGSCKSY